MRKISLKPGLLAGAGTLILCSGVQAFAIAQPPSASNSSRAEAVKGQIHNRLAEDKLKVCKVHEKVVASSMERIGTRGERHLAVINKIADRVEAFYTKSGKNLSNYDALVTDVNAKKAAATTAVEKVKADRQAFKCDGNDPKGVASSFKDDLKLETSALKNYKTAVKNLIVGVKSVQGTSDSDSAGGNQ
jgi:hypothetical protein